MSYSREPFRSLCPIVRTDQGPFARWIDLSGGLRIMSTVTFDAEIVWLRDSGAEIVVRETDGRIVHECEARNDFYGYLTSLGDPIEKAPSVAARFGVTPEGPLSVEVRLVVEEKPAIAIKDEGRSSYDRRPAFRGIPEDWFRADDPNLPAWAAATSLDEKYDLPQPTFVRRRVIFEGLVWSSRNGLAREDQRHLEAEALIKALDGLPEDVAAEACKRIKPPTTPPTGGRETEGVS